MKYLCWDVDGTLLLTNRAGYDALIEAIRVRFRKPDYKFTHSLAGTTDSSIVKEVVTDIKGRCTSADAASFLITYHMLLSQYLPTHKGWLMPNVKETLAYVKEKAPEWENCLLTGNTFDAAKTKVKFYQIAQYFDFNHSVYGDLSESRNDLAKILYTRLLADQLVTKPDDLLIIGDTVHDAACAAAINAPCLIVLAGSSSKAEDFKDIKPWKIIDKLPDDPAEFIKLANSATSRA
jgi:phosphoglycolate phosphatase